MVEQKSQKGADGIIMKRKIPLILYRKSKKLTIKTEQNDGNNQKHHHQCSAWRLSGSVHPLLGICRYGHAGNLPLHRLPCLCLRCCILVCGEARKTIGKGCWVSEIRLFTRNDGQNRSFVGQIDLKQSKFLCFSTEFLRKNLKKV